MLKLLKSGLMLAISGSVLFVTGCGIQKMIKKAGAIDKLLEDKLLEGNLLEGNLLEGKFTKGLSENKI